MPYKPLTDIKTNALRGGSVTVREKPLLAFGAFSMVQNMRGRHPGFKKRKGQIKLHSVADGTNQVVNLYQFSKSRVTESHLYAQMSDGDVLVATNAAPTVTAGVFGTQVHDGTATNMIPASWSNLGDKLIYSNGVDQHQLFGGTSSYVDSFMVYKGSSAIPNIPTEGQDYSVEVSDGRTTTTASLNSLSTLANYDCIFIRTPVQIKSLTFTFTNVNGSAAVAQVHYWKGAWTAVTGFIDGTSLASCAFGQNGTMEWTAPTDIEPHYMYGACGWWYRISLASGGLDSSVSVQSVTFNSDWQSLINMWDGTPQDVVEVRIHKAASSNYELYGSTAVDFDELSASDEVYCATTDPVIGFYIDPGALPSSIAGAITEIYYWDGHNWRGIVSSDGGTVTDGTAGITQPGWVTFTKPTTTPQARQFQGSTYHAYWYYFKVSVALSADTTVGIQYMPYFDINDLGRSQANCVWKDRAVYAFDRYSEYAYFSATSAPFVLNGSDYGIIEAGDGRSNKIVAMRKFHNELMIFQEEKGEEGGCITLIEGYTPATFGKLVISTRMGTMNNKSVVVVDGVLTSTRTDEKIKTIAFFLSRYGVGACDGRVVNLISDDIQNYFNPNEPECIRKGYESKMWLGYDSGENVLRLGLVSGNTATECNVFPVYDLDDNVWYFDTPAQELSCMTEVGAASGNVPVVQIGGGIDDGFVYLLNSGNNDVAAAVESFVRIELGSMGEYVMLREILLRSKSEEAGEIYIEVLVDGISKGRWNVPLTAQRFGSFLSRIRKTIALEGSHLSLKIGNFESNQEFYLEDLGLETYVWKKR